VNELRPWIPLCYLLSAGVDIKAILISPGDESQIAIVDLILTLLNKSNDVIIKKLNKNYSIDFSCLNFIRSFKDGVTIFEPKINMDLYKGGSQSSI
jgi:hypothetical protein